MPLALLIGATIGCLQGVLVAAFTVGSAMKVFTGVRRHARSIAAAGGSMMVVLGVLQVAGVWAVLVASLQGLIVDWQAPL